MPARSYLVHLPFPLWQFLTQPVFKPTKMILNPFQFQYHYRVQLLERCWNRDFVRHLERCWLKELRVHNLPGASEKN